MWIKVRKKPVEVKAFQFKQEHWEKLSRMVKRINGVKFRFDDGVIYVETLEGEHMVSTDDWIIEGIKGEHYPCKPDIFELTYEEVKSNSSHN